MSEETSSSSHSTNQDASSVTIGDVDGGIHDSTIAGRDVHVHNDKVASDRGVAAENISESIVITGDENKVIIQRLDPTNVRNQRNHQVMRHLVSSFWIDGVLKHSLYNEVLIRLNLEKHPSAVDNRPWDLILQQPGKPNNTLPPGTAIVEVFDQMNQLLLILGEPGSGKTTMLLELAEALLKRAEVDPTHPTPVVFNLSSWAEKRPPLADWLIEELRTKYNIPKKVAVDWVENDELLLLLDGLDEVKENHRNACAEAINTFRQQHLVPLVVCSRIVEYGTLTTQLKLQGAVSVQPLTKTQIDDYLNTAGKELVAVRTTLQQDIEFQDLATSPLMLSVMTLAYQGKSSSEIPTTDSSQTRRQHLFDTYIRRMFAHRGILHIYPIQNTLHWLSWLARHMRFYSQTEFRIEGLRLKWLQVHSHPLTYRTVVLLSVLPIVLPSVLLSVLLSDILGILLGVLLSHMLSVLLDVLPNFGIIDVMIGVLIGGVIGVLSSRVRFGPNDDPCGMVIFGLLIGLLVGLSFGWGITIIAVMIGVTIVMLWGELSNVQVVILIVMLLGGMCGGWINMPGNMLSSGLRILVILGLIGGLGAGGAIRSRATICTYLNQGIKFLTQKPIFFGLTGVLIGTLTFEMMDMLTFGLSYGLLFYVGNVYIQRITTHFLMYLFDCAPLNYARFLNYCYERIFLQKVGGGYIFIHRMLLEHFASLTEEDIRRLSTEQ